jgi:hypothetical protein
MLWYHSTRRDASSGSYFKSFWDEFGDEGPVANRARVACGVALDQVQEYVVENTVTHSWPGGRRPPEHHVDVEGNKLHLWFGDEGDPVYEIGFIEVSD